MAESIGRTTRLNAVNGILRNIGEREVSTLVDSTRADVAISQQELDQQSREVQAEGWTFNTEEVTLSPDAITARIAIDENVLSLQPLGNVYTTQAYVERGDWLYDRSENTYQFTDDVEALVIRQLPFEDLPEQARFYIMMRAGRVVAQNRVGDPVMVQFSAKDEAFARYQLEARETESADFNALVNHTGLSILSPRRR